MKFAPKVLAIAVLLGPIGLPAQTGALAPDVHASLPAELRAQVPAGRLAGRSRLVVWGFQVYDAALWVTPGFKAHAFEGHALALELTYLRRFTSEEIAKRSLSEMGRQRTIPPDRAALWERQLREVIPDVQPGDRIMGIYQPGGGATFLINRSLRRTLHDVELSRLFFGIWLSESSSEPGMRRDLLSLVDP